jgi:hypothetical protein
VCSSTNKKNGQKVAIKKVSSKWFNFKIKVPNAFDDLIDAKRIVREIKLLSTSSTISSHPNRILRPRERHSSRWCLETRHKNRL